MVMRLFEFQSLPEEEQITILYRQGIFIGKKKSDDFTKLLYQLESFYVEVIYASYRRVIHKIRYSDATSILDPYLEQIRVEYLET